MDKIKVLIVDDSAVVRQALERTLSSDKEIEVIGSASDPYIAAKKMQQVRPDERVRSRACLTTAESSTISTLILSMILYHFR